MLTFTELNFTRLTRFTGLNTSYIFSSSATPFVVVTVSLNLFSLDFFKNAIQSCSSFAHSEIECASHLSLEAPCLRHSLEATRKTKKLKSSTRNSPVCYIMHTFLRLGWKNQSILNFEYLIAYCFYRLYLCFTPCFGIFLESVLLQSQLKFPMNDRNSKYRK